MPDVANSRDTMIRIFFSRFQIMKCFNVFEIRSMENHKAVSLTNEGDKTDDSSLRVGSKWSSASMASSRSIPELYEEKAHRLRVFELSELRRATNDFDRLLKIGEGGFGSVYKGIIKSVNGEENSTAIAVKRLKRGSLQGHKQWIAEVQCLGVVEHPNLVKLIGYCSVDGESGMHRMLVYEYMPNKTLDHHLFNARYPMLPWDKRLQIILGAAQGLAYLHEEMEVQVIYRDFKASNVLLDEKFQPKLSDFGLAREGPTDGKTHVSTAVVGTHGYAAPDYIQTGHLTIKSDVWSFGVVLYELLTGRRSIDRTRPKPQQKLLEWVKNFPSDSKKFPIIMDPRLRNHYPLSVARTVAKLADDCLIKYPKNRPKMSEVVQRLKQAIQDSETSIPIEPSRESTPDFGIRRR